MKEKMSSTLENSISGICTGSYRDWWLATPQSGCSNLEEAFEKGDYYKMVEFVIILPLKHAVNSFEQLTKLHKEIEG